MFLVLRLLESGLNLANDAGIRFGEASPFLSGERVGDRRTGRPIIAILLLTGIEPNVNVSGALQTAQELVYFVPENEGINHGSGLLQGRPSVLGAISSGAV